MKPRTPSFLIVRDALVCLAALLCSHTGAHAQTIGDKYDKPGDVQRQIVPKELIPPATPRSAEEEMKTFTVAPGFRVELVASEPMVEDPVSIQFDADGRLWVAEMRGYMNTLDGGGEDQPNGRIVVLEDTDGDGKMDKRTVFADGLIMPRAVMPVGGGALVGEPPRLWFMRDTDGDARADQKDVVMEGFGAVAGPGLNTEANHPARGPNSPTWMLDNWIYFAHHSKRLRYEHGKFIVAPAPSRGQYGISQDDAGRQFFNSNSDQLRADPIPAHYASRNPYLPILSSVGVNVNVAADQLVWPVRVNPGVNRGYKQDHLREGRLRAFTAACSPTIYRGDLFPPDFRGNAFVCEPAGNLIHRNVITEKDGKLVATNGYEQAEFIASTDERFRPVSLASGPDGCLYIADFYRGIIEHKLSLTTYFIEQIKERGLVEPLHKGRIFRVVPKGAKPRPMPKLSKQKPVDLVAHLAHPNGWWCDTAQRLIVEQGGAEAIPALKQLVEHGESALGRLHALWTLEGLAQLEESTVTKALHDADANVRRAAVRLSEPWLQKPASAPAMLKELQKIAGDAALPVRVQLALTLGEARLPEADQTASSLMDGSTDPLTMAFYIASGMMSRELDTLRLLHSDAAWRNPIRERQRLLRTLAACLAQERNAAKLGALFDLAGKSDAAWQQNLMLGITDTKNYLERRPVALAAPPEALDTMLKSKSTSIATAARNALTFFTWPGREDGPKIIPVPPLTADEQKRFDLGKLLYTGTCAACHQTHGRGQEGMAPPLLDSEWVTGPPDRLAKIALHGVYGPILVAGKRYWLDMPAFGAFPDDQLAAILTYLRREWEHGATPIAPEFIGQIRRAHDGHAAWTAEELLKVP